MVIKKRNTSIPKIDEQTDLAAEGTQRPRFGMEKTKTWADEVVEVLGLLEKKGINIYDKTRHGGMYLKKKNSTKTNVESIFTGNKKTNKVEPQEEVNNSDELENLFNHFKPQK